LHYSVGIEVIGYYERVQWPEQVARLVGGAVRALQTRLAISSDYLYATAPKPGMTGTGDAQKCAHPERLRFGGLSSHRDYNKPECPGSAITEAFYTAVVRGAPSSPPPVSLPTDPFERWGSIGKPEGIATGFAVPKAWLVNKVLGACVQPETYAHGGRYSVTEFENGIVLYLKQKKSTQVVLY
jgi:hypothetical protein